jgi:hypothetical protein
MHLHGNKIKFSYTKENMAASIRLILAVVIKKNGIPIIA